MNSKTNLQPKVTQYLSLRRELEAAKQRLERELKLVTEALEAQEQREATFKGAGSNRHNGVAAHTEPMPRSKARAKRSAPKGRSKLKNAMTLRETVNQVLEREKKPMTKKAILAGVQELGYKSNSRDPMGPLSVLLYRDYPRTKDGLFSLPVEQK